MKVNMKGRLCWLGQLVCRAKVTEPSYLTLRPRRGDLRRDSVYPKPPNITSFRDIRSSISRKCLLIVRREKSSSDRSLCRRHARFPADFPCISLRCLLWLSECVLPIDSIRLRREQNYEKPNGGIGIDVTFDTEYCRKNELAIIEYK